MRQRFVTMLLPEYRPRLTAVAKGHGMTVPEYIEWSIDRDERALKQGRPIAQAALGRQLLRENPR